MDKMTRPWPTPPAMTRFAHLWVIYPGKDHYTLNHQITVVPACEIPALLAGIQAGTEPPLSPA